MARERDEAELFCYRAVEEECRKWEELEECLLSSLQQPPSRVMFTQPSRGTGGPMRSDGNYCAHAHGSRSGLTVDEHMPAYVGIWVLGDAGVEAACVEGADTRHQSGSERLGSYTACQVAVSSALLANQLPSLK